VEANIVHAWCIFNPEQATWSGSTKLFNFEIHPLESTNPTPPLDAVLYSANCK
jgi:hypothetical protein